MNLQGKKIILGITASIAAYKAAYLIRLLIKEGCDVQVITTPATNDFIGALTLSALSSNPVMTDSFVPVNGKWNSHVDFGLWADIMIIAPATANTLAKMANGIADNLLLTTYLAARCPVFIAPAMDMDMFIHPATQKNINILKSYGNIIIEPSEGFLASGLNGIGRMQQPEDIVSFVINNFGDDELKGKNILITAGPTYEPIDPVRFIGNHSSGLMGFSIADEFALRGADVTLVSGPTNLINSNQSINRINVNTAKEMFEVCSEFFPKSDITIMAAAVADWTYSKPFKNKIKKNKNRFHLELEPTIDILSELGKKKKKNQILIGFALESENEIENAKDKLKKKNLDFIILNSLNDKGATFKNPNNKISIIDKKNNILNYTLKSKTDVAKDIVCKVIETLKH